MNILATTFHDLCFFSNDISRLMLAIARFAQKYAISQKQSLRGSIIFAAPRENIYRRCENRLASQQGFHGVGSE